MNMKKLIVFLAFLLALPCGTMVQATAPDPWEPSPWGVAAHLRKKPHIDRRRGMLDRTRAANIKWLRDDFQFSNIFKDMDTMDFTAYDALFADTDEFGVGVLGILEAFDNELENAGLSRYVPIYNHLDAWLAYVRATVERYHNRIKHWEVWNEQDGGFWKPSPNAAQYVRLLKETYVVIKDIDPEAVVIVGGLSGFDHEYLKGMYAAGAKGYFDAIAVHPYNDGPDVNRKVANEREQFLTVLADEGQADMPLWITECGGSSYTADLLVPHSDFMLKAIRYGLSKLGRDTSDLRVGLAVSPRKPLNELDTKREWLPGIELRIVPFDELPALDPADCPVLIGAEGGSIDAPLLDPLRDYVKRGGLMLAVNEGGSSIPFYTLCTYDEESGLWVEDKNSLAKTMASFRMKYEAFWTMPDGVIPESTSTVRTADDALAGGVPLVTKVYVNRFVNGGNMQEGDTYYPIVEAYKGSKKLPADGMGLYTYGDWEGGILYSAIKVKTGYTTERQANLLQRVYLSYLSLGIKKIFWYDLHNDGATAGETEQNFGLLDVNGNPKPAYWAYRNMTRALGNNPQFEQRIDAGDEVVWALVFRRAEDGRRVLAAWSTEAQTTVQLDLPGLEDGTLVLEDNLVQFIELQGGESAVARPGWQTPPPFYVSDRTIHLTLPAPSHVSLFDTAGRCLAAADHVSEGALHLEDAGVYVLRVQGKTAWAYPVVLH